MSAPKFTPGRYAAIVGDEFAPPANVSGPVETAVSMPRYLSVRLPCCDRQEHRTDFYAVAEDVARFTCKTCGGVWHARIVPEGLRGVTFHHNVYWTCVARAALAKARGEG